MLRSKKLRLHHLLLLELRRHQVIFAPDRNAISLYHWDILRGEERVLSNIGPAKDLGDQVCPNLLRKRLLYLLLHLVMQGKALIFAELLAGSNSKRMHVSLSATLL